MNNKIERRLLIDDCRDEDDLCSKGLPCRVDLIARNYEEGLNQLLNNGRWDVLYIDHDLNSFIDGKEHTGYDIMCELEIRVRGPLSNKSLIPKKIICVSSNPAGRKRIEQVIETLKGIRD